MNNDTTDKPDTKRDEDIQESNSESNSTKKPSSKKKRKSRKRPSGKRTSAAAAKKGVARGPRPFPAETLEQALRIPAVIKNKNGGNSWPPSEVGKSLEMGAKTNAFYYLSASARDYGFTVGTRDSDQIALSTIGRELLYATSPEAERDALKTAFFNVPVFKSVYEYYKGGDLPELKYLQNTLESVFNVPTQYHEEFVRVYTQNCKYLEKYGISPEEDITPASEQPGPSPHSIVVGAPKSKTSKVAFVIMPFIERTDRYPKGFFEEVLRNLITPAAVDAGFKVETAKREGSDVIHSTIVNDLLAADLVVADLTEHNPNVLFELGIRMASEKPTALIRARGTGAIFDVDNLLRVLDYDPNLWKSTIESDVPKISNHIKGTWDGKGTSMTYMQILKRHE